MEFKTILSKGEKSSRTVGILGRYVDDGFPEGAIHRVVKEKRKRGRNAK